MQTRLYVFIIEKWVILLNEDMSEMIKNFSQMLNNQQMPDNIKNILMNMSNNSSNNCNSNNNINQNVKNNYSNKKNSDNNNNNYNNNNNNNNNNSNNNFYNSSNNDNSNNDSNNNRSNNIFGDIDMNTIFKIQKVMNSINNDKENDYRTNLLKSLKPYLKESRKNKIDQYIQLMKMEKIFEIMNPLDGGDKKNV